MLKQLVYLNNEHSRAPLRPKETRPRRRGTDARPANIGRKSRAVARGRSIKDAFAKR